MFIVTVREAWNASGLDTHIDSSTTSRPYAILPSNASRHRCDNHTETSPVYIMQPLAFTGDIDSELSATLSFTTTVEIYW